MRIIVIDPAKREVREETVDPSQKLKALQKICDGYVTPAGNIGTDDVYVDDEGLLKDPQHFFTVVGMRHDEQPLAGNGVVVGIISTGEGDDWGPATVSVEEVRAKVRWHSIHDLAKRGGPY